MTGRDVLNSALIMLDRITDTGAVNTDFTQDYVHKALECINGIIYSLQNIEKKTYSNRRILDLNDEIPLDDVTIDTCLKPFLCSNLAFLDNDINMYNYYSALYEKAISEIPRNEEDIEDHYGILDGMTGV